mmetsp:Transcript_56160/g.82486  ORF Transcript_56160/g.82486 Transcript_56160/m.82486 type:complete len:87 (+) Transcript_56160:108-368(+)
MVESLSAQEAVHLVAWRKTFRRIPYKTFLQVARAELKTGDPAFTNVVATIWPAAIGRYKTVKLCRDLAIPGAFNAVWGSCLLAMFQ